VKKITPMGSKTCGSNNFCFWGWPGH